MNNKRCHHCPSLSLSPGFPFRHAAAGLLSMANSGADSNGSQFFLTFAAAPHLDGKHVVFGRVEAGMDVVEAIEAAGRAWEDDPDGAPSEDVTVVGCGRLSSG